MFEPGQKVLCINDQYRFTGGKMPTLNVGSVYVVKDCGMVAWDDGRETLAVWLVDTPNFEYLKDGLADIGDMGFGADRFRPIDDPGHIIEMFRAMTKTRQLEDA